MKTLNLSESILRSLQEPILVLDGAFRALVANPAFYQTLQISQGQLEGKRIQELISDEKGEPHLRLVLGSILASVSDSSEAEIVCNLPQGERMALSINARTLPVDNSEPVMILVELRDITKAKEYDDQIQALNLALHRHSVDLEAVNRDLESFTHSVSHDLRTPLRFVNNITHLLLQDHGADLPADVVQKAEMILLSTSEMTNLIDDLLAFSKVGREPLGMRRVDMLELVREAIEDLQYERSDRNIEFVVEDLASCYANRGLLKQAILNLLANAIKFTRPRENAQIRLGCAETSGETVYFVHDNGVGLDPNELDTLFLPFHRSRRSDQFEGTGIGLALVRRIIVWHQGRIWAEGEIDKGSTFFFTIGGRTS